MLSAPSSFFVFVLNPLVSALYSVCFFDVNTVVVLLFLLLVVVVIVLLLLLLWEGLKKFKNGKENE